LKELVGLNHSSLKCTFPPPLPYGSATSGVQPSPSEIGDAQASGNEAAYLGVGVKVIIIPPCIIYIGNYE
jgi:hypothetical protein